MLEIVQTFLQFLSYPLRFNGVKVLKPDVPLFAPVLNLPSSLAELFLADKLAQVLVHALADCLRDAEADEE